MREAAAFCRRWNMLPRGSTVLCALSGGRDSMALLHFLLRLAEEEGFRVEAAHFNHCLRETAERDEAFCRDYCGKRGIPLTVGRGDVSLYAEENGVSVEDAARTLRYRFLEETAAAVGADRIATAHHRQDNAETVLLHLLRGTGLHGLTGIPPVRGAIVRPLLDTERSEIDRYVAENHIPYVEDETNHSLCCTRNHLRLEILPLMEELSPGCTGRIAEAASRLLEDDLHIERETERLLPPVDGERLVLPLSLLRTEDTAIQRRLILAGTKKLGVCLSAKQLETVCGLETGGSLDLPDGLWVQRSRKALTLLKKHPAPTPVPLTEGSFRWGDGTVTLYRTEEPAAEDGCTAELRAVMAPEELVIAPCTGEGRMQVKNGSRTVKRILTDHGVSVGERQKHPVILWKGEPVALMGVAADPRLVPEAGEERLVICWDM